jgi:general secretion pathway protein K
MMRQLEKGVALITALLIMALVATLAYTLEWNSSLDLRRTIVMLNRDQAIQIAFGAESWMQNILLQDIQESETDHLGEIWASDLPGLPIDGGEIFGSIEDLQGRFNVNNLIDDSGDIDEAALAQFGYLLAALGLDEKFAGITADWIDADRNASFPFGAEDSIYTGYTPPYRAANQGISSASELGAIEGMDKETLDTLLPHIVALPRRTGVNVNTATGPVLQSLGPGITVADVEGMLAEREETGFADLTRTFGKLVAKNVLYEESSTFFQLKLVVRIDTVRITYYSILEREPSRVTPILRSLGTT